MALVIKIYLGAYLVFTTISLLSKVFGKGSPPIKASELLLVICGGTFNSYILWNLYHCTITF